MQTLNSPPTNIRSFIKLYNSYSYIKSLKMQALIYIMTKINIIFINPDIYLEIREYVKKTMIYCHFFSPPFD
ncbi:hypothetical protein CD142_03600 [Staphylococcus schleiferi subsp. schleiferi]|uniref:Uncharacterized protein n=1 Tax=Staphylococcus schleiferi TaxID=1295 RepID=A0ABX0FY06_STASC|nr:hypothetical protein [Staphylococcus schleiferi]NHA38566.1 hypothetical protein [Staphylococcus schleiferi]NHA39865.1 hypothetical protein [Staphylococcus schleiferi]NHA43028.1 hypothetical protein [Staphylococcus schleiferi]RTX81430.1 hypothetical protein CD142_03600 [Staphylococcus schleiferi subsp. schleiferi]